MKIDFTKEIFGLDGKPVEPPLALKEVATTALLTVYPDERDQSGQEKARRFSVAMRIYAADECDLTADEVASLKALVAKSYGPLVVGRAWEILDPPA